MLLFLEAFLQWIFFEGVELIPATALGKMVKTNWKNTRLKSVFILLPDGVSREDSTVLINIDIPTLDVRVPNRKL